MLTNNTKIIRPRYPVRPPFESFYQKEFKTVIHRLTNSQKTCAKFCKKPGDVLGGYHSNSERHYSNCDDTLFACQASIVRAGQVVNVVNLYGQDGSIYGILPRGVDIQRLWWSNSDPVKLYSLNGKNSVTCMDVINNKIYPVVTFESFNSLGLAGGEGDISHDETILLDRDGKTMFIYDLKNKNRLTGFSSFDCGSMGAKGQSKGVDYATVSRSGKYILVSWSDGVPGHRGIEKYNLEWNFLGEFYPGVIHWCCGYDWYGTEVIYTVLPFGFPEYIPAGMKPGDFVKINIETGVVVKLLDVPLWSHLEIAVSRTNHNKVYVAYEERELQKSAKTLWQKPDWSPYFGELLEIDTDGSGTCNRLCHTYSRPVDGVKKSAKYWQSDNFVFGNKIGFRSCMGDKNAIGDLFFVEVGK